MTTASVLIGLVLAAAGLWLARSRFLIATVDGISMEPTVAVGEKLLVRRAGLGSVQRGGLVVIRTGDRSLMVKRAVALPGDPVPPGIPVREEVVPPGRVVVLGDNADNSFDSRASGFVHARDVVGVVVGARSGRR